MFEEKRIFSESAHLCPKTFISYEGHDSNCTVEKLGTLARHPTGHPHLCHPQRAGKAMAAAPPCCWAQTNSCLPHWTRCLCIPRSESVPLQLPGVSPDSAYSRKFSQTPSLSERGSHTLATTAHCPLSSFSAPHPHVLRKGPRPRPFPPMFA